MSEARRIVVAVNEPDRDRIFDASTRQQLAALGQVEYLGGPRGSVQVPPDIAAVADILVTSWSTGQFDPEILQGPRLRLAVHSAGSIRGLFPRSALDHIRLAQGGSDPMAAAVAEMALTMTLALLRNLPLHDRRWQGTRDWQDGGNGMLGRSLTAQRIGLVSLSRVGVHYARMVNALGAAAVSAYDPYVGQARAAELGVELSDLTGVCASSDVLAIHAPVTPETRGMIGAREFALLGDDAIVINTARAAIVDQKALESELTSGRLRAGLDVFHSEPLAPDSPLFGLDGVLLTPHVAGGTVDARFAQGRAVVAEIERFFQRGELAAEVTADNYDRLS